jgi:predicted deacylase
VHGTEYTSIEAVRIFARGLDPAVIAGRITAIPVVNVLACAVPKLVHGC